MLEVSVNFHPYLCIYCHLTVLCTVLNMLVVSVTVMSGIELIHFYPYLCIFSPHDRLYMVLNMFGVSVTAIPGIKYPIPSELGSQTTTGVVSTAVGDHAGIRRVVTFLLFLPENKTSFDLQRVLPAPRFFFLHSKIAAGTNK